MNHQTEIQIPNGRLTCQARSEIMKKTKCFKCQKEIYIVYTTSGAKLPVSKEGDKLVTHSMVCTHSPFKKQERRLDKQKKEYEKRISEKGIKKVRRN